jgi:VWFA-related protein
MNIRFAPVALAAAMNLIPCAIAQQTSGSGNVIRSETRVVLVDAVVTNKKGEYVHDLTAKDFKVYEDKKEQTVTGFSWASDPASAVNAGPRRIVLFFDNSTMTPADQLFARKVAARFIDANAGPDRLPNLLIAVVNFGGTLEMTQNFTADVQRLKALSAPSGPLRRCPAVLRPAGTAKRLPGSRTGYWL